MLARLYVKNFALIEEAAIEFGPGLNVVTGETGAGKSILMGALYSILGGPVSADLVRGGADRCLVEGLFEFAAGDPAVARLSRIDCPVENGQLVLRREIRAGGRARALVDDLAVSQKRLRQIGSLLVDLHGQHEHQYLLDARFHAGFLDSFGGLNARLETLARLYRACREDERALAGLRRERQALVDEEESRLFQLREIRALQPRPGEEEELERELQVQENLEILARLSAGLDELFYQADGSVFEQLGQARRQLDRLLEIDPSLARLSVSLAELSIGVEDLAATLRDYARKLEPRPGRAEWLRERLDGLRRLQKKYGRSLEQLIALVGELERRENRSGELDGEIGRAADRGGESRRRFAAACLDLSAAREQAAGELSRAVEGGLVALGMPQTAFRVRLSPTADPAGLVERDGQRWRADERGLENVEFYLSTNPGEELRPLARIASGGEISRIMLTLKSVIAGQDEVSTLVFDEIDAGISGRIAAAVGRKLRDLSASHQTVVITHLPQIAGMGQHHFSVRKRQLRDRTVTQVQALDETARTEEIASLLAGETISETARQHAQEMLK
jgi:DNA repair protein RecN (Recombination protein N)